MSITGQYPSLSKTMSFITFIRACRLSLRWCWYLFWAFSSSEQALWYRGDGRKETEEPLQNASSMSSATSSRCLRQSMITSALLYTIQLSSAQLTQHNTTHTHPHAPHQYALTHAMSAHMRLHLCTRMRTHMPTCTSHVCARVCGQRRTTQSVLHNPGMLEPMKQSRSHSKRPQLAQVTRTISRAGNAEQANALRSAVAASGRKVCQHTSLPCLELPLQKVRRGSLTISAVNAFAAALAEVHGVKICPLDHCRPREF